MGKKGQKNTEAAAAKRKAVRNAQAMPDSLRESPAETVGAKASRTRVLRGSRTDEHADEFIKDKCPPCLCCSICNDQ
jgi:hypothetical protein